MISLYLFSLVLGGGLLLVAAFGEFFGDHTHDMGGNHAHASGMELLSLRTLTYFLFAFGGAGSVLSWAWKGRLPLIILALALVAGLAVGGLAAVVFRYLRATESGDPDTDEGYVGLRGSVTVPLSGGHHGKVLVERGDRTIELMARPFEVNAEPPEAWKSVVIVEMQNGTALVSPVDERLIGETTS